MLLISSCLSWLRKDPSTENRRWSRGRTLLIGEGWKQEGRAGAVRDHETEHGLERGGLTELRCWWGKTESRKSWERQKNAAYLGNFGKVSFVVRTLEAGAAFHHRMTSFHVPIGSTAPPIPSLHQHTECVKKKPESCLLVRSVTVVPVSRLKETSAPSRAV